MFSFFFFFNDTATTEIYTFPYTTLFRSNRQHGNDGSNSKNHTEHGEQRAQLVAGEVLKAKGHIRQPLRQGSWFGQRSEEHTSELQSRLHLVCRLLLEKKKRHNAYSLYVL